MTAGNVGQSRWQPLFGNQGDSVEQTPMFVTGAFPAPIVNSISLHHGRCTPFWLESATAALSQVVSTPLGARSSTGLIRLTLFWRTRNRCHHLWSSLLISKSLGMNWHRSQMKNMSEKWFEMNTFRDSLLEIEMGGREYSSGSTGTGPPFFPTTNHFRDEWRVESPGEDGATPNPSDCLRLCISTKLIRRTEPITVAEKDTSYLRPLASDFLCLCVSWGPHYTTNGRHRVTLKYLNYVTATWRTGEVFPSA